MAVDTNNQLFRYSKVFALVDADAFDDIDSKPKFKRLKQEHEKLIKKLPITPEVFFISELSKLNTEVCAQFRKEMHCELTNILSSQEYTKCNDENERKLAKSHFEVIVDKCCESTGDDRVIVIDNIIKIATDQIPNSEVFQFLGPIFNAR